MSDDTSTPRVSRYRTKYKTLGFKRLELLVHKDDEDALKQVAEELLLARIRSQHGQSLHKKGKK